MIAVLYARRDSHYKLIEGVDVWDEDRDARLWPGHSQVVAHPPCRAWGRFRKRAKPAPHEKDLAIHAAAKVRGFGGVLEHPAGSTLWAAAGLPVPGDPPDEWGGWTLPVQQFWWGHKAEKKTWFYIVGCCPEQVPPIPFRMGYPTHYVASGSLRDGDPWYRPSISKAEREHTPPDLCRWLIELAGRCRVD